MTNYILVFINIFFLGCQENTNTKSIKPVDTYNNNSVKTDIAEYIYSPSECPFQVTFLEKPEIASHVLVNDENFIKGETAYLEIESQESFIKAEFLLFKKEIDEQAAKKVIKQYADTNGLNNVSIDFKRNEMGAIYELRGFKTLQHGNNPLPVTYTAKYYFNGKVVLILYGGCPSKSYPATSISNFYNSLRKK